MTAACFFLKYYLHQYKYSEIITVLILLQNVGVPTAQTQLGLTRHTEENMGKNINKTIFQKRLTHRPIIYYHSHDNFV